MCDWKSCRGRKRKNVMETSPRNITLLMLLSSRCSENFLSHFRGMFSELIILYSPFPTAELSRLCCSTIPCAGDALCWISDTLRVSYGLFYLSGTPEDSGKVVACLGKQREQVKTALKCLPIIINGYSGMYLHRFRS